MDHVVPLIRGGKSTRGNTVPACSECNSQKKYLLPVEWERYLRSLSEEQPPEGKGPEGTENGTV